MYAVPRFSDGHWPSTVIETFLFPATRAFHLVLLQGWEGVKEIFTRATSARREKPVADRGFSYGRTARRRTIARELTFFAAFDFLVDARTSRIRIQLLPSSHRLLLIAAPTIVWRPGWCCNVDWPFFFHLDVASFFSSSFSYQSPCICREKVQPMMEGVHTITWCVQFASISLSESSPSLSMNVDKRLIPVFIVRPYI